MTPAELRDQMHRLDMTQADLAIAMGVSQAAVSRWLAGTRAITLRTELQIESLTRELLGGR